MKNMGGKRCSTRKEYCASERAWIFCHRITRRAGLAGERFLRLISTARVKSYDRIGMS